MATLDVCECGQTLGDEEFCPACERPVTRLGFRGDAPYAEPALPRLTDTYEAADVRAMRGMCSPLLITLASWLFGPLAGFLLLARNDAVLGRRRNGWVLFLVGLTYCVAEAALLIRFLGSSHGPEIAAGLFVASVEVPLLPLLAYVLHDEAYFHSSDAATIPARAFLGRSGVGLLFRAAVLFLSAACGQGFH